MTTRSVPLSSAFSLDSGDQQFGRPPYMGMGDGRFNGGIQAVSGDSHVSLGPPPLVEDPSAYNEVEMEDTERSECTSLTT